MLSFKAEIGARLARIVKLLCAVFLTCDLPFSQTSFSLHDNNNNNNNNNEFLYRIEKPISV